MSNSKTQQFSRFYLNDKKSKLSENNQEKILFQDNNVEASKI